MERLPHVTPIPALAGRVDGTDAGANLTWLTSVLVRRGRLLFTIFAMLLAAVIAATMLYPRSYTTEARLIAGTGRGATSGDATSSTNLPILNALLVVSGVQSGETYAELLTESPVAQQVIDNLHLDTSARGLLHRVKISPVTNTSIIALAVTWSNPEQSARIANEFASVFITRERDLIASQANSAIAFLTGEMPAATKRLAVADGRLQQFEQSHHIADLTAQTQNTIAAVANVESKTAQVQLDARQAQAQLASLQAQRGGISASTSGGQAVSPNPVFSQLQTQLAQVDTQLGTARAQYTDEHPTVKGLLAQQAQIRRELASTPATIVSASNTVANPVYAQISQQAVSFRAQVAADTAQLAELSAQRALLMPQLAALPAQTQRFSQLTREQKLADDVYTALQQKLNDATIMKSTALSDVTITQTAAAADAVVRPNRPLTIAIGALLSLIIALSFIALLDFIDGRLRDEEEIRRDFALPVLGSIPALGDEKRPALPWVQALTIESFLQLVRTLRYSTDRPLRSLAITSPVEGDGKSTLAVNLARTISELEGPVLLIDADLRRPVLHNIVKVKNTLGLGDVLTGHCSLESAVQRTKVSGLDLLTSGTRVPNPVKLLESERFQALLDEAHGRYRMVILDLPSVLPIVDAAIVGEKVDGLVMVLSVDNTDRRLAQKAIAKLEAMGVKNVLGIIVNRVRPSIGDQSDYYLQSEPQAALL
ncbi:MAG TPA: polysaccharide biosynthesis tyrosine autokinase [Candidatus Baltobacteraceae bacterium]